jgi:hypothetical protein
MDKAIIDYQKKFEFYFVALVFTILGLSIQTSVFTNFACQYVFELLGWLLLLISGLAGLSRMEWIPAIQLTKNFKHQNLQDKKMYEDIKSRQARGFSGKQMPEAKLNLALNYVVKKIGEQDDKLKKLEKKSDIKYHTHKWLFPAGLILIILSRAIYHLHKIYA